METHSGTRANPLTLTSEDVVMDDIITSLGRQRRFLGHTFIAYSVLEHSILVQRLLKSRGASAHTQLAGLLHDAKEAYVGDIPTPVKRHFKEVPGWADLWMRMEEQVDTAIAGHMGMPWLMIEMMDRSVVTADIDMLAFEAQVLMHSKGYGWTYSQKPGREGLATVIHEWGMLGHYGFHSLKKIFNETMNGLIEEIGK